jgi:hypothetical protein
MSVSDDPQKGNTYIPYIIRTAGSDSFSPFKDFLQHISMFPIQPSDIHPWRQAPWYLILESTGGMRAILVNVSILSSPPQVLITYVEVRVLYWLFYLHITAMEFPAVCVTVVLSGWICSQSFFSFS